MLSESGAGSLPYPCFKSQVLDSTFSSGVRVRNEGAFRVRGSEWR